VTPQEAQQVMLAARADPVAWCEATLGFRPWDAQRRIMESVRDHRYTSVRSCHGIGKSTTAAATVLWFLATHPGAIVITTATSYRQVVGILWREITTFLGKAQKAGRPLGGRLTKARYEFSGDWYAWGFTANDYDATAFQGFHAPHILIVVDEAAGVRPEVYEGLDSAMAGGNSHMLMIGNPTTVLGEFGDSFKRKNVSKFAVDAFKTPNFTEFGITVEDIRQGDGTDSGPWLDKMRGKPLPYPQLISPLWVRERWIKWCGSSVTGESDPRWVSRVRANFPVDDETNLIPFSWIELANQRWHDIESRNGWRDSPHVTLGIDVARLGNDNTQIARHHIGLGVRMLNQAPKMDTMGTAAFIAGAIEDARARGEMLSERSVRIDADGLGAGVFDRVREDYGDLAFEIRGGMSPRDDSKRFANRRAEMFWNLRELLDPASGAPIALPPDDELTQQLLAHTWSLKSRGLITIESKDEIKAKLKGQSPDKADAIAYACEDSGEASTATYEFDMSATHVGNTWEVE